jgi:cytochrome c biogenesis protein CcmG/thiol:disulfide interchange protein DsbE
MTLLPDTEAALLDAIRRDHAARPVVKGSARRHVRRSILAATAVFLFSATAFAATQVWPTLDDAVHSGARPPAPASELQFPILGSSDTASLSEYRGKIVVLSFFASWCQPCRTQAPLLEQTTRDLALHGEGTAILVGYKDADASASQFVADNALDLPVLEDKDGALAAAYGVLKIPATFVIDRKGQVVDISRGLLSAAWLAAAIAKAQTPTSEG